MRSRPLLVALHLSVSLLAFTLWLTGHIPLNGGLAIIAGSFCLLLPLYLFVTLVGVARWLVGSKKKDRLEMESKAKSRPPARRKKKDRVEPAVVKHVWSIPPNPPPKLLPPPPPPASGDYYLRRYDGQILITATDESMLLRNRMGEIHYTYRLRGVDTVGSTEAYHQNPGGYDHLLKCIFEEAARDIWANRGESVKAATFFEAKATAGY